MTKENLINELERAYDEFGWIGSDLQELQVITDEGLNLDTVERLEYELDRLQDQIDELENQIEYYDENRQGELEQHGMSQWDFI